jgi:3-phenylpropionate/trans-cinnamate dioxygenase ferredoxin reductase subunit
VTPGRVLIVGASLAGATTAVTLRRLGFSGELVLIGDESHPPYERPALTKGYLAGDLGSEALLVHPPGTYAELGIEVRSGWTATALDVARRSVRLSDGDELAYDTLVLATGSTNVRPPIPGMNLAGVHQLRRIEDADRLAAGLRSANSIVVVGMGFIGCEVAATARGYGLDVTMLDRLPGPLVGPLGPTLSQHVRRWHEDHGVHLRTGVQVGGFEGNDAVEAVRLAEDTLLPADLVVVGVGVRPATDWLADSPLDLVRGAVSVDDHGRTSVPQVYAAGDVAAVWDAGARVHRHVEHYRSAIDQGARVAHAVLDLPLPSTAPSWFWTEQYDHILHLAGDLDGAHMTVREQPFAAFFTRASTLTGIVTIDNPREFRRGLRLLGSEVSLPALTDPGSGESRSAPRAGHTGQNGPVTRSGSGQQTRRQTDISYSK